MDKELLELVNNTFETEGNAILHLKKQLPENFDDILRTIYHTRGRMVIIGMGKSGIAGRKIAATMASTGTSAFYIHPGEAFHGDLGMILPEDVVMLISQSGETEELIRLIPFLEENSNSLIAMTGKLNSTLARHSHYVLNVAVDHEACLLDLAPTASVVTQIAMGDALSNALMKMRGFTCDDYARFHPGGSLGRRLLARVEQVMRQTDLPVVEPECRMIPLIDAMNRGRIGVVVLCCNGKVEGIITDGDLRRNMELHRERFFALKASEIATTNPQCISPRSKLTEAEEVMNRHKIHSLLVTDDERNLLGVVEIYDLAI